MNYSTSNWNLFSRYYLINWFKIWYWWTESHDLVRFILLCFKSLRMSFQLIALIFSSIICPSYVGSKNLSKFKFQNYWFLHYLAYVLGRWDTGFGGVWRIRGSMMQSGESSMCGRTQVCAMSRLSFLAFLLKLNFTWNFTISSVFKALSHKLFGHSQINSFSLIKNQLSHYLWLIKTTLVCQTISEYIGYSCCLNAYVTAKNK